MSITAGLTEQIRPYFSASFAKDLVKRYNRAKEQELKERRISMKFTNMRRAIQSMMFVKVYANNVEIVCPDDKYKELYQKKYRKVLDDNCKEALEILTPLWREIFGDDKIDDPDQETLKNWYVMGRDTVDMNIRK